MPAAGQLNTLINILKPFDTKEEGTGETLTEYRPYHRKIPANRDEVSGGSTRRGQQVEETVKTVLTIPFIQDIEPSWQVQIITAKNDGPILDIVSILDREDRRTWLQLHCSDVR